MRQEKGSYFLLITLEKDTTIQVGKLGEFRFSEGYYLYAGSALGGIDSRIRRHLRSDKKMHWHIDYLMEHARIVEVWYMLSEERLECFLVQVAQALPQARMPVQGFGSSDCRCPSHLVGLPVKPVFADVAVQLERISDRRISLEHLALPDVP